MLADLSENSPHVAGFENAHIIYFPLFVFSPRLELDNMSYYTVKVYTSSTIIFTYTNTHRMFREINIF